jgi:hypothetical protein
MLGVYDLLFSTTLPYDLGSYALAGLPFIPNPHPTYTEKTQHQGDMTRPITPMPKFPEFP